MAVTATISLSSNRVRQGERFSATLSVTSSAGLSITGIFPTVNLTGKLDNTVPATVGAPGPEDRAWGIVINKANDRDIFDIGATLRISDGTRVTATVATLYIKDNPGQAWFDNLTDSGLVPVFF